MTEAARPSTLRRIAPGLLKLGVLAALAIWLLGGADTRALWEAAQRLPLITAAVSIVLAVGLMAVAAIRWRMLMRAFGATEAPNLAHLLRLILIGMFYNTFVPGTIGGDIVRGAVSRKLFENPTAPYVVVLLERLIGLSALGVVFLGGALIGPRLVDLGEIWPWLAVLVGGGALLLIVGSFTGRLGSILGRLPVVHRPAQLIAAFVISFAGHAISIAIFWVLARGLALPVDLVTLLQVVPLGLMAAVIPLAIVGIGPREVALVGLLGVLGIARGDALALSLGYAATIIVIAAFGGLLQLLGGELTVTSASDTTRSSEAAPPRG